MLLTVDMGNTNITLGAYRSKELLLVTRLATDRRKTADQYAVEILDILKLHGIQAYSFSCSIMSSVVPELTAEMASALRMITGKNAIILGPGTKTGLNILIDNPAQVGSDLVAGAVAAANLYPLPCLVVDLGTATKISLVDKNGDFCGCTIAAGVSISLEALASKTSQLPNIHLTAPARVVGKNTVDSMQSGTVFGTAAMIDGLCDRIEEEIKEKAASIVATGGLAEGIIKSCKREIIFNRELILEGLRIIYEKNIKTY